MGILPCGVNAAFICRWMVYWSPCPGSVSASCCREPTRHACVRTLKMSAQPNQYPATEGFKPVTRGSINISSNPYSRYFWTKSWIIKHLVVIPIKIGKRHQAIPSRMLVYHCIVHQLDAYYMSTYAHICPHTSLSWWCMSMMTVPKCAPLHILVHHCLKRR